MESVEGQPATYPRVPTESHTFLCFGDVAVSLRDRGRKNVAAVTVRAPSNTGTSNTGSPPQDNPGEGASGLESVVVPTPLHIAAATRGPFWRLPVEEAHQEVRGSPKAMSTQILGSGLPPPITHPQAPLYLALCNTQFGQKGAPGGLQARCATSAGPFPPPRRLPGQRGRHLPQQMEF